MRNYINELKAIGYTQKQIAAETNIPLKRISAISRNLIKIKSSSKEYETIRNISRKVAYSETRKAGLTPVQSHKIQRIVFSGKEYHHISQRIVKQDKFNKIMYQLKLTAEYKKAKIDEDTLDLLAEYSIDEIEVKTTGRKRIVISFSNAHVQINNNLMFNEARNEARSKLGGSNWILIRIIDKEIITYNIG